MLSNRGFPKAQWSTVSLIYPSCFMFPVHMALPHVTSLGLRLPEPSLSGLLPLPRKKDQVVSHTLVLKESAHISVTAHQPQLRATGAKVCIMPMRQVPQQGH